jgi:hypothetical protein
MISSGFTMKKKYIILFIFVVLLHMRKKFLLNMVAVEIGMRIPPLAQPN